MYIYYKKAKFASFTQRGPYQKNGSVIHTANSLTSNEDKKLWIQAKYFNISYKP